jgi:murein DD-endopeptidase MepM/ murein hydrolase activator NlpD
VAENDVSNSQTPTRRQLRDQERQRIPAPSTPVVVPQKPLTQATSTIKVVEKPGWGRRILSWGTVIATPLLFIGVSLPVNLFYASTELSPAVAGDLGPGGSASQAQSFTVASTASNELGVQRESWSVTSFAQVLQARYGNRNFAYSTTGTGNIRWPFPTAVPISSGFGDRVAPCRYCSSSHRGLDFTPGNGSPIFAVADGVVTQAEFGGGYGQHVYIEHRIDGQSVLTVYAHMQSSSSPLRVGDTIAVGDFIGLVGNTGTSTGPHLHLEVRINGEYVNPFTWLKENAF